jgi:hypothetical protein
MRFEINYTTPIPLIHAINTDHRPSFRTDLRKIESHLQSFHNNENLRMGAAKAVQQVGEMQG